MSLKDRGWKPSHAAPKERVADGRICRVLQHTEFDILFGLRHEPQKTPAQTCNHHLKLSIVVLW